MIQKNIPKLETRCVVIGFCGAVLLDQGQILSIQSPWPAGCGNCLFFHTPVKFFDNSARDLSKNYTGV